MTSRGFGVEVLYLGLDFPLSDFFFAVNVSGGYLVQLATFRVFPRGIGRSLRHFFAHTGFLRQSGFLVFGVGRQLRLRRTTSRYLYTKRASSALGVQWVVRRRVDPGTLFRFLRTLGGFL